MAHTVSSVPILPHELFQRFKLLEFIMYLMKFVAVSFTQSSVLDSLKCQIFQGKT